MAGFRRHHHCDAPAIRVLVSEDRPRVCRNIKSTLASSMTMLVIIKGRVGGKQKENGSKSSCILIESARYFVDEPYLDSAVHRLSGRPFLDGMSLTGSAPTVRKTKYWPGRRATHLVASI